MNDWVLGGYLDKNNKKENEEKRKNGKKEEDRKSKRWWGHCIVTLEKNLQLTSCCAWKSTSCVCALVVAFFGVFNLFFLSYKLFFFQILSLKKKRWWLFFLISSYVTTYCHETWASGYVILSVTRPLKNRTLPNAASSCHDFYYFPLLATVCLP